MQGLFSPISFYINNLGRFKDTLIKKKPIVCYGSMWKNITDEMEKRIFTEGRETGLISCFEDIEKCVGYVVREI